MIDMAAWLVAVSIAGAAGLAAQADRPAETDPSATRAGPGTQDARWVAIDSAGECSLQFRTGSGVYRLKISQYPGNALAVETATDDVDRDGMPIANEIYVLVDGVEAWSLVQGEVRSRETVPFGTNPLEPLLQELADASTIVVRSGTLELPLSLDGFGEARARFDTCRSRFDGGTVDRQTAYPSPPILKSFEGMHDLTAVAGRQRMLSQKLEYTLVVDDTGVPVRCDLSRDYRRKATEIALCRPLLEHMRFEPARNAEGEAVAARFVGTLDMRMGFKDGHIVDDHPRRD